MKVLFDLVRGQISIEGDGQELITVLQHARDIAPKLGEIRLITGPALPANAVLPALPETPADLQGSGVSSSPRGGVPTLREFAKRVSPSTVSEKIVAIGFYQARYHGQDSFSPREMAEWFTHAGFERPTQMPVAIFSTKKRYGFLENPSHGRWKLTVAGENAMTRKLEENEAMK